MNHDIPGYTYLDDGMWAQLPQSTDHHRQIIRLARIRYPSTQYVSVQLAASARRISGIPWDAEPRDPWSVLDTATRECCRDLQLALGENRAVSEMVATYVGHNLTLAESRETPCLNVVAFAVPTQGLVRAQSKSAAAEYVYSRVTRPDSKWLSIDARVEGHDANAWCGIERIVSAIGYHSVNTTAADKARALRIYEQIAPVVFSPIFIGALHDLTDAAVPLQLAAALLAFNEYVGVATLNDEVPERLA